MDDKPCRGLRRDAARNRERVLKAARELFVIQGLEATLNDVAKHANVGVGTVYRRFPTKEDLVEAIRSDQKLPRPTRRGDRVALDKVIDAAPSPYRPMFTVLR